MYTKTQKESLAFWERFAQGYDEHQGTEEYERLACRIASDVGDANRVLDIACGTGIIALEIAKNAGRVEAIDFSSEMITIAWEKARDRHVTNVNFSTQAADRLDFADDLFDAVVVCNSLHVMKEPEQALAEARRVLKADGLLVVSNRCLGQTQQTRTYAQKVIKDRGFPMYHLFTTEDLGDLVQSSGFAVTEQDRLQDRAPMAYLLARPSPTTA
jgi:ubiquinone/menaquinone biosynthesis C-methylase UbiE